MVNRSKAPSISHDCHSNSAEDGTSGSITNARSVAYGNHIVGLTSNSMHTTDESRTPQSNLAPAGLSTHLNN